MNVSLIITIIVVIFIGYMVYSYRKVKRSPALADSDKIKNLTAQNFQQEIKSGTVLVDFWASWCMPCKMMAPVLNELAEELPENTSVAKLNVEHFQAVSAKYQVKGIPTMILFRNGKEVSRFVGVKSKDFLKKQMMKVA